MNDPRDPPESDAEQDGSDPQVEPEGGPLGPGEADLSGAEEGEEEEFELSGGPGLAGTAPRWADLEGYHTRFGDVRPLLTATDDRYVIMNAGDELALRFAAPPPVAPGMVRDFVVIGDGWVKDGDFNTTFSRTVLPLPTHASGRYDRAPRALEDDPVFQRHPQDFETYHTRYVWPVVAGR